MTGALRPETLADFSGQARACDNLRVFVDAARVRGEALDHVLIVGPPGTGKTTLAQIIARELGAQLRITSGPILTRPGDLAAVLTALPPRGVLFVDEIHRMTPSVEELLYAALEDFRLDIMLGGGPQARTMRLTLNPFTLIGATTRSGLLSRPLRERFGIPVRLDLYEAQDLVPILRAWAESFALAISEDGLVALATRARGTPRTAVRLLRRVRDFALSAEGATQGTRHSTTKATEPKSRKNGVASAVVSKQLVEQALTALEVDGCGLDTLDRRFLTTIANQFAGGPVGVESLAAALGEQRDLLEEVVEPFLLRQGLIARTRGGRILSPAGFEYLSLEMGLEVPPTLSAPEATADAQQEQAQQKPVLQKK